MGYIYKITNTVSGKCYIGETKVDDPGKRWAQHIQVMKRNQGCPALKDAMKKYGVEKFTFQVLIICFDEDRFIYEKEYIKKYNSQVPNGYNILPGGEGGGFLGKKHTKETLEKISQSGKLFREKNPNYFETYREKLRKSMKKVDISSAVKSSDRFQQAVKEGRVGGRAHEGGKLSEETKQKIRESVKRYYNNLKNSDNIHNSFITRCRKISQYSKDGSYIKEFPSISEASREFSIKISNIQRALAGSIKTAGGYIWKYVET